MCVFTRHPKALVRVISLELRACARWVLSILLTHADAEGRCWVQVPEIRRLARRSKNRKDYSKPSILRSLRELRDANLVAWDRVAPGDAFPGRRGEEGRSTKCGGRVWVLNLPVLRGNAPPGTPVPCVGTKDGGGVPDRSPMIDRRSIMHDRSSDPLCLPPEDKIRITPSHGSGRASAAPTKDDGETPGAASDARAPSRDLRRLTIESETPRAPERAAAPSAPPAAAAPPRTREAEKELEGVGRGRGTPEREPKAPEPPATVAELERGAWADLRRLGLVR